MINKFKYIIAVIVTLSLSGCVKKWLDEKPDGSLAVPATIEDFRAMLDEPVTALTNSCTLCEFASDQDTITEAGWASHERSTSGNAYTWVERTPYNAIGDYTLAYKVIFTLNVALDGLEKMDGADMEVRLLKGRAYFNRGRLFAELAQMFAPPYSKESLNSEYGIPLRVNANVNEPTKRSTLGQTYERIISDIKSSAELLPNNTAFIQIPTKHAAWGYLARVYLIEQKFDSALHYAKAYLKEKSSLLDFNTLSQSAQFINPNIEMASASFCSGAPVSRLEVPKALYDQYEENDLRKYIFFKVGGAGNISFSGSYALRRTDTYTGISTDEMYLIAGECLARSGKVPEALKYLNDLSRSRYRKTEGGESTYMNRSTNDPNVALTWILKEREKQLLRRGVRWSDLRRLNTEGKFKKILTRSIAGQNYVLEPNSEKYTFPIPREVILNASIKQNPGW
ncbi:RagB/SusD family nutrient uptake outer membrane protein [Chitinophaga rhizosphaerae]|uniref:RagB/SusD family nutrient uptake outer membrane protein n=1 Tax=Chitinophaga rhizosphaerae TaxID=1864947 RepID=UPI000F7FB551|nr:RagB/SusD family nutrient uptake outer membrane protein [Chitinophaga rhizosphaerae]